MAGSMYEHPRNWLIVPEWGVRPRDVAFEGFRFPFRDRDGRDAWYASVRMVAGSFRREAQGIFSSLAELHAAAEAYHAGRKLPFKNGRDPGAFAFWYLGLLDSLDLALSAAKEHPITAAELLGRALIPAMLLGQLTPSVRELEPEFRALAARRAASKKNWAAREWVWSEWEKHGASEYGNNKTKFCETYVRLVANKFQKAQGEPLKISQKQMRDVWLSGAPRPPANR